MDTRAINWHIGDTQAPLPPQVPGSPFLGNARQMGRDLIRFLVESYLAYGPIFRLKLLNQSVTIMAGLEANKFATQHDEEVFTNEIEFAGMCREIGPTITGMPPDDHRHMRRLQRPVYARSLALERLPILIGVADEFVDRLKPGDSFEVFPTMQNLVVTQLGCMLLNQAPGDYFPDFRRFMLTWLRVYQYHTRPGFVLKLPAYRRAKARSFEMARGIVDMARSTPPGEGRPANGVDALLQAVDREGKPYSEEYLLSIAMGPYLAGQDTVAGTMSFICYTLHKHRDVLERIIPEVRAGFAATRSGMPNAEDLRKFETLHRAVQETMRRYPVSTVMPRHATKRFEFAGYRVEPGTKVYNATAVTHFLPEYYPEPFRFNIDREHGPAGTFAPYGVGNYACLGAGIADVQLMATTAALLRRGRFELDPPGYEARLKPMPLPNPGRYRLKLVEKY